MELVLRDEGREAGCELKLPASLRELLRRIESTRAKNPKDALAYQVIQEITFQMRQEDLLAHLIAELLKQPSVKTPDDTALRRDPERSRNSEVHAVGADSSEPLRAEEPEPCVA